MSWGGYNILAYEHEGTQVCEWLNEIGITGILLKYRVPRRKIGYHIKPRYRIFSEQWALFGKMQINGAFVRTG